MRTNQGSGARFTSPRADHFAELERRLTRADGPFALHQLTVGNHRLRVWRHQPDTLRDVLERARHHADAVYLVYGDERITYADHHRDVADLADHLVSERQVRQGERIAVAMRNLPEWSVAFWAVTSIGAVAVPLNAWWTGVELEYALRDSAASLLVCDDERFARISAVTDEWPVLVVRRPGHDALPRPASRWEEHVGRAGSGAELPAVSIAPDDDATLLYTSGTTGPPKGVVGSHRNICGTIVSVDFVQAWSTIVGAEFDDDQPTVRPPIEPIVAAPLVLLLAVPLFHATGLHGVLVGAMARGARIVMMHKWDAATALALIEKEGVTAFTGVPSMVRQLADHAAAVGGDLSSLGTMTSGGALTPPDLIEKVHKCSPSTAMRTGYGLTESSTVVAIIGGRDYEMHPESVGVPIPICDVRIVDEVDDDVAVGDVGQILLRGSNIVRGYWNRPEETAEAFRGGWFHTGDLGRFDTDGYLYIVDRLKDLVIRAGENISASEVESVLFRLEGVADVAVVAVPHDVLGEEVGAIIQRRTGVDLDADAVQVFAREYLAGFKIPAHVWFTDVPLPRNPAGKVLKRELRAGLVVPPAAGDVR